MPPASELPARVASRSRAEAHARTARTKSRLLFIVQCGLGAALAWWVAGGLLGHPQPFFAPVTAIISLGMSYGQRVRRVIEVMLGVAIGVFIGDAFSHIFGSGVLQILVVVVLAMSIASLCGAGMMLTTQAGVQSAIITTLAPPPNLAFTRWTDAVIGGAVALAISALSPATGLHRPRQQAAEVLQEVAAILRDTSAALRTNDLDRASAVLTRARGSEPMLDELHLLADEGVAVVRLSPLRRRHLPGAQEVAELVEPLDRTIRNLRVLVRRAAAAIQDHESVPATYIELIDELAQSCDDIARRLHERHQPRAARAGLERLGQRSADDSPRAGLSSEVIRAQVRSMTVDLLVLTGMSVAQARSHVPLKAKSQLDDSALGDDYSPDDKDRDPPT